MFDMPLFRVTLQSIKTAPIVTPDGRFGKTANFRIERLDDGQHYSLEEAHGGGDLLELRCERLEHAGGVTIEAPESPNGMPETPWKEQIVNLALEKAGTL